MYAGLSGTSLSNRAAGANPPRKRRINPATAKDPGALVTRCVARDAPLNLVQRLRPVKIKLAERARCHQEVHVGVVEGGEDAAAAGVNDARVPVTQPADVGVRTDRQDAV